MARAIVLSEPGLSVAIASVDILLVPAALREQGRGPPRATCGSTRSSWPRPTPTPGRAASGTTRSGPASARARTTRRWRTRWPGSIAGRHPRRRVRRGPRRRSRWPASPAPGPGPRTGTAASGGGRLLAVRVERPGGEVVGQVVVFPAHATVRASRNRLLSGDWPGALARELSGVTVFLQGAEGDQTWVLPAPQRRSDPSWPTGGSSPTRSGGSPTLPATGRRSWRRPRRRSPCRRRRSARSPPSSTGSSRTCSGTGCPSGPASWRCGSARPPSSPFPPSRARRWGAPGAARSGPGAEVVSLVGDYVGYVETPEGVRARTGEAKRTYLGPELSRVLQDGLAAAKGALPPALGEPRR